ncbi:MAG: sialate O-acetylesterase, partial [Bacteroidota bacterium]
MTLSVLLLGLALTACDAPSTSAAAPEAATTVVAADLPDPIYEAYDFFVVAGQSNAKGRGDSPLAPEVPPGAAYEVTPSGVVSAMADPVGGANTGSAWPAFANAYSAATGRGVVIVGQAVGGASQVALAGDTGSQTWDVSRDDNLYTRSDRKARRALRAAEDALPGVRAVGWLWIQGGTDARRIEEGVVKSVQYESALHDLARRVDQDWGVPVYLFVSGTDARGDFPGAVTVREIQNAADALDEVVVVYRDAFTFPARGWMQPDNVHWSQPGLNEAGTEAGAVAGADRLTRLVDSDDPTTPNYSEAVVVFPNPSARSPQVNAGCPFRYEVVDRLGRRVAE